MKVIFLDVDGVLTTTKTLLNNNNYNKDINLYYYKENQQKEHEQEQEDYNYFVPLEINLINNLKYIIQETNSKIVITSTWRLIEEMKLYLIQGLIDNGISKDNIISETIRLGGSAGRGAEIRLWLNENDLCTNYVIIDDEHMENFKRYGLQDHVVQTILKHDEDPSLEGLTIECSQRAIEILLSKE